MNSAEKLRIILRSSGYTQTELADRLGVSFATLNSWVNGRSSPRPKATVAIDVVFAEVVEGNTVTGLSKAIASAEQRHFTVEQIVGNPATLNTLTLAMTYHTDAIEGSTMTADDTEAVLFDGKTLTNRTQIEQLEAKNHQAALWWLLDELRKPDFAIDEQLVLALHTRLMNGILSNAGSYRNHGVRILGTKVAVANYMRIPDLLRQLFRRETTPSLIPLLARHHAEFERIHPFSDGNGRVGRLLLLAFALQYGSVPPIITRERRVVYYKALEIAQTSGGHEQLELFLAESIIATNALLTGDE